MHELEAVKSIGTVVLAKDEYWGVYTGALQEVMTTKVGMMCKVKIMKNIVKPCQHAIFFPENSYARQPYSEGSIQVFCLESIERDETYECY